MEKIPIELLINLISAFASFVALIIAIVALVYTAKTYLLKSGAYIRGQFASCMSISCDDIYVNHITLENLKDRAIVIFKIYLLFGYNYFVEIDDFEGNPLILKPFELFDKEYDPIEFYSEGMKKVLLNNLFDDESVKKRIVLSTSEGKYVVKNFIKYWDPSYLFFNNFAVSVIRPTRSFFKGKAYGSNAKYIVEFKMENRKEEIVPIYPRDYEIKKFMHFSLTKESLTSKEKLKEYLQERITEGKLKCSEVFVLDMNEWRNVIYKDIKTTVTEIRNVNWFEYHVLSRIGSIKRNFRMKKTKKLLIHKKKKERSAPYHS